jgi:hypothetical protein
MNIVVSYYTLKQTNPREEKHKELVRKYIKLSIFTNKANQKGILFLKLHP